MSSGKAVAPAIERRYEVKEYRVPAPDDPPVGEDVAARMVAQARILWEQRHFLWRATKCGLILFAIVAFLIPKHYKASTQLMPPDNSSNLMTLAGMAGLGDSRGGSPLGLASQLLGLKTPGQVITGVLNSRTVQDRLIERFQLMELYSARYIEDARKELASNTEIVENRKSGIISITVEDKSPERVAQMAQAYAEELNRVFAQVNTSAAHRERLFVEERLREVKAELDTSAKEFSEFASKNATIDIAEQGRAMVGAAADLQAQLIVAQSELKGLEQIYTTKNVRVRQVKARIAELEAQLAKFGGKDVAPGEGANLTASELYPSIRKLPLMGVKYMDLYRRTKIAEAVFEMLTKQYEIAKVQEAREVPSVAVLDAAVVPQKKSFPPRLLIILFGAALSFLLAAAWVLCKAYWEATDIADPRKAFTTEVFLTAKARTWDSGAGQRARSLANRWRVRFPIMRFRLAPKLIAFKKRKPASEPLPETRAVGNSGE